MHNIEQWRIDSALWHFFKGREKGGLGFIYLWVSMTPMNSEEITLCSGSVDRGGPSAFESQWHQWTVKRSLCALAVFYWGGPSAFVSQWHQWTVKRSLCALAVLPGGYCKIHLVTFLDIFLLLYCLKWVLIDHIEKQRVADTNEQWRDHSVLWQC